MPIKKEKKPILVKYSIGQSTGDENVSVYGDWQTIFMLEKNISSAFSHEPYGTEEKFDLVILLDANSVTRQIDEKSIFLIDEYPTSMNSKGNYRIKKKFPEYLGLIKLGLESIKGTNHQNLYYLNDDNIYSYQLNYDKETNIGYIDKNSIHPFTRDTKVWLAEPVNKDDNIDLIEFVSENTVGIIDRYKSFKALSFKEL